MCGDIGLMAAKRQTERPLSALRPLPPRVSRVRADSGKGCRFRSTGYRIGLYDDHIETARGRGLPRNSSAFTNGFANALDISLHSARQLMPARLTTVHSAPPPRFSSVSESSA